MPPKINILAGKSDFFQKINKILEKALHLDLELDNHNIHAKFHAALMSRSSKKVARKVKMMRNYKMAEMAILNLKMLFLPKI